MPAPIWRIVVFLGALLASTVPALRPAAAGDAPKPPLVLLLADTSAPKMYLKDGEVRGFISEIAIEAVRRAGYEPDVQPLPWIRAFNAAKAGTGVIPSLSYSEERAKVFHFSNPMHEDRVLLVTLAERNIVFDKLSDLSGLLIGNLRGSRHGPAFEAAMPAFTLEEDDGTDQRLRKLMASRLDGGIFSGGLSGIRYNAERIGANMALLRVHSTPIAVDKNHFGVAKTRPNAIEEVRRLNRALESMWGDGTIRTIVARYEGGGAF